VANKISISGTNGFFPVGYKKNTVQVKNPMNVNQLQKYNEKAYKEFFKKVTVSEISNACKE
jgi:hypothetical protein